VKVNKQTHRDGTSVLFKTIFCSHFLRDYFQNPTVSDQVTTA